MNARIGCGVALYSHIFNFSGEKAAGFLDFKVGSDEHICISVGLKRFGNSGTQHSLLAGTSVSVVGSESVGAAIAAMKNDFFIIV